MELQPIPQPGMRSRAAGAWFIVFWLVFVPGVIMSAVEALTIIVSDANEPIFPEILLAAIPGLAMALAGYFIHRGLRFDSMWGKALLVVGAGLVYWYAVDALFGLY